MSLRLFGMPKQIGHCLAPGKPPYSPIPNGGMLMGDPSYCPPRFDAQFKPEAQVIYYDRNKAPAIPGFNFRKRHYIGP